MRIVVLDTNAILMPFLGDAPLDGLDGLLGAVRLVAASSTVAEARRLAEGNDQRARAARLALDQVLPRCVVEPTELPGDDGVLDVARRLRAAVVTNDRRLQQECRRDGLTVVATRQRRLWLPFGA